MHKNWQRSDGCFQRYARRQTHTHTHTHGYRNTLLSYRRRSDKDIHVTEKQLEYDVCILGHGLLQIVM